MTSNQQSPVSLDNRVAVITGAGNGMGEATAHSLASRGAAIVIVDLDVANGERVTADIREVGGSAIFVHADATDEADVDNLVDVTIREFGGVDILDNNAAALGLTSSDGSLLDTDCEHLISTLRANVAGPYVMCQKFIPAMIKRGGGSIVNVSSLSALRGELGLTAYGMSKAALIQFTRAISTQYGPDGIRCNAVAPSYVSTPNNTSLSTTEIADAYLRHTPIGRLVAPQDVADVVAFLASDAARSVSGLLIPVDGGLSAAAPTVAEMR